MRTPPAPRDGVLDPAGAFGRYALGDHGLALVRPDTFLGPVRPDTFLGLVRPDTFLGLLTDVPDPGALVDRSRHLLHG
ncbi:hypothetical protein [Amycolatopsis sp. NPDC051903]|uniref:hypothetical protein n=1 Tax=Amycolatopsis sp. NPDC051903 TaxID=3363936 RepID=UPI0037AAD387